MQCEATCIPHFGLIFHDYDASLTRSFSLSEGVWPLLLLRRLPADLPPRFPSCSCSNASEQRLYSSANRIYVSYIRSSTSSASPRCSAITRSCHCCCIFFSAYSSSCKVTVCYPQSMSPHLHISPLMTLYYDSVAAHCTHGSVAQSALSRSHRSACPYFLAQACPDAGTACAGS